MKRVNPQTLAISFSRILLYTFLAVLFFTCAQNGQEAISTPKEANQTAKPPPKENAQAPNITPKEQAAPVTATKSISATFANTKGLHICSWNIRDLGKSKSAEELAFMAELLRDFDIVAVQEVVTSIWGTRAVAKLAEELNRKGAKWEYVVSETTNGEGIEKYAYFWKTAAAKLLDKPFLLTQLDEGFDREPFLAKFRTKQGDLVIANFHAVPQSKDPENEIARLDRIHLLFEQENLLIMGDFNLDQKHKAFEGLKNEGYSPTLIGQKTSFKRLLTDEGEYLHEEYDNIFLEDDIFEVLDAGIIDFYPMLNSLDDVRLISDHVPIWVTVSFK